MSSSKLFAFQKTACSGLAMCSSVQHVHFQMISLDQSVHIPESNQVYPFTPSGRLQINQSDFAVVIKPRRALEFFFLLFLYSFLSAMHLYLLWVVYMYITKRLFSIDYLEHLDCLQLSLTCLIAVKCLRIYSTLKKVSVFQSLSVYCRLLNS